MNRTVKIYVLKNPKTDNIHYVGRSLNPDSRYRVHIHGAKKKKKKNKKEAWICSLLNEGLRPKLEIIDNVNENNAVEKEKFWIEYYFKICDLKNSRDYFENDYLFSEETRKKMSIAAKRTCNRRGTKTSEEGKKNIGLAKKGIKQSKNHIEKKSKPILQYDLNGVLIKEWLSGAKAARELNLSQGTLSNVLTKKKYRKTYGGYIWKFKNEVF